VLVEYNRKHHQAINTVDFLQQIFRKLFAMGRNLRYLLPDEFTIIFNNTELTVLAEFKLMQTEELQLLAINALTI